MRNTFVRLVPRILPLGQCLTVSGSNEASSMQTVKRHPYVRPTSHFAHGTIHTPAPTPRDLENVPPFNPSSTLPVQLLRIREALSHGGCTAVQVHAAANPRTWARLQASGLLALLRACDVDVLPVSGFADAADVQLIALGHALVTQYLQQQQQAVQFAASTGADMGRGTDATKSGAGVAVAEEAAPPTAARAGQAAVCTSATTAAAVATSHGTAPSSDARPPASTQEQHSTQRPCLLVMSQDTRFAGLLAYARDRGVHTVAIAPFKPPRPSSASMARPQVCWGMHA